MPEICRFNGITIHFYYDDHNPPHFHAVYGKNEALFSIDSLEVIKGKLPKKITLLIVQWAFLNREKLKENWKKIVSGHQPNKIKPLNK
jgi:hypothetical protein